MRKSFSLLLVSSLVIIASCKKDDNDTNVPLRLTVTGIADSIIVDTASSFTIGSNVPATFALNKASAGTVAGHGVFTAGNTDGAYTITITNNADTTDRISRTVVVTKNAALFNNMRNGGYVIALRHAHATDGGDQTQSTVAEWWKSCDRNLARQLTPGVGPQQADTTGRALKLLRLPFDSILSSVYCRCVKTAEGFNLGLPIVTYEALSQHYDEPNRYEKTMRLYASKPVTQNNVLVVTQGTYANLPAGSPPINSLEWGDCIIFKQNGTNVPVTYVTIIRTADWMQLAR